jgi:DNA mismatch repair ATPase MutL
MKQALCVIAGVSKEEPNKLPRFYKVADKENSSVFWKSKNAVVESSPKAAEKAPEQAQGAEQTPETTPTQPSQEPAPKAPETPKAEEPATAPEQKPEEQPAEPETAPEEAPAEPEAEPEATPEKKPDESLFKDVGKDYMTNINVAFGPKDASGEVTNLYVADKFLKNNKLPTPDKDDVVKSRFSKIDKFGKTMYVIPIKRNWNDGIVGELEEISPESFKTEYIKNVLAKVGDDIPVLVKYQESPYMVFTAPEDNFAHESFASFRDAIFETIKVKE